MTHVDVTASLTVAYHRAELEIECNCRCYPGEPRTHDYPGSAPSVEVLDMRTRRPNRREWRVYPPEALSQVLYERVRMEALDKAAEVCGERDLPYED